MDGVSTMIGFIENGIKLVKFVRETWGDLKTAPEQLRSLLQTVFHIDYSLRTLQYVRFDSLGLTKDDTQMLDQWASDATRCLDKITRFTEKVDKSRYNGETKVNKWRWLWKGSVLEEVSEDWGKLQNTLNFIMVFVNV